MSEGKPIDPGLDRLNSVSHDVAVAEFRKCCGCSAWAEQLAQERPFETADQLIETAERIWWSLDPERWLEAFHSHPKIGEKKAAAAISADAQRWSEAEQSGIRNAAMETIDALAELNVEYEKRFGYIFIICASGKTSDEMLAALRERLGNPPETELKIAAAEQAKITRLRLNGIVGLLIQEPSATS